MVRRLDAEQGYGPSMRPDLFVAIALMLLPTSLLAQTTTSPQPKAIAWELCQAVPTDVAYPLRLIGCQPAPAILDPQGKSLWLRAKVERPQDNGPIALRVVGAAASEAWLNGTRLGNNGQPAASKASEIIGRYEASFPIYESFWRQHDNHLIVHLSSFHGLVPLDRPMAEISVAAYPGPSRAGYLALTFLIAGSLFAGAFGFGVIHSLRRSGSSLALAALAALAGMQAVLESLRVLSAYTYPLHGLRLMGIWALSAGFALLLVFYVVSRFRPKARRPVIATTLGGLILSLLAPGYDLKTLLALMIGLGLSAIVAGLASRGRVAGAWPMLVYLLGFMVVGALFPIGFIDLSFFLFAAGLILPLLMAEVIRLGRDDQKREQALTRAVALPDALTLSSSRGVERIPLDQIIAIVGADDYVEIRLLGGRTKLHSARLERLQTELPSAFLRIHRTVIANLTHARGYERRDGKGLLLMRHGPDLPISRNRFPTVRQVVE